MAYTKIKRNISCFSFPTKGLITWQISAQVPKEILLKWKWRLHGEDFCPGWKCSSWAGRLKNLNDVIAAKFQPGLKRELEQAHWRNIQRNKMAAMEKLCLNPGWNSPCNRNKISARGAGWNFSPSWNSPCNHPLTECPLCLWPPTQVFLVSSRNTPLRDIKMPA